METASLPKTSVNDREQARCLSTGLQSFASRLWFGHPTSSISQRVHLCKNIRMVLLKEAQHVPCSMIVCRADSLGDSAFGVGIGDGCTTGLRVADEFRRGVELESAVGTFRSPLVWLPVGVLKPAITLFPTPSADFLYVSTYRAHHMNGDLRSSTQNVDPSCTFDRTPSRPPLRLTICRTSASPRPVPFPPCCRPISV